MPLYNPVNVPVTGPQGLNNWDLGVPDLGGGAYVRMAQSIMSSMDKSAENIGTILQQRAGSSALLNAMANAKIPGTKQNMFDPELMNKIAKGPLAAQQQFLGTALSTYAQAQQEQAGQTAQMRMLQQFQQNPNLLRTNILRSGGNLNNMPAAGSIPGEATQTVASGGEPTQTSQQANPSKEQTKNSPKFTAPPGYNWDLQKHNGNDVHVLYGPDKKIAGLYNPDGSLYGQ